MAKKTGPYVGVTGFMSRDEVAAALARVPEISARRLMVGVLMSSKTLAGQQNKWPGRYPKREAVKDIFIDDPRAINLVHYSTDQPQTLCEQLEAITLRMDNALDGFQLNVPWPPLTQLQMYRKAHPEKVLVLQIGQRMLSELERSSWIYWYGFMGDHRRLIDFVLVDASVGTGKAIDPVRAEKFLNAFRELNWPGIGIAGGLGPDTLHLLDPFIQDFPQLSIDAESRLRTPPPEDKLCLSAMCDYLDDAFRILEGEELPGMKLRNYCPPYGFAEHGRRYGTGDNCLRTERLAQPSVLQPGDLLATGDRVLSLPREAGNGGVWLHLTGGSTGHWVNVPARMPIALLTEADDAPEAVRQRDEP